MYNKYKLQSIKRKEYRIKDLDCTILVEETSRKEILSWLDEYIENLQYKWFNPDDEVFMIMYDDGTEEYINSEYDRHKIKRQHIISMVYSNPCSCMTFGKYHINEYGVVTPLENEEMYIDSNIELIKEY